MADAGRNLVSIAGADIEVRRLGSGPPLLFLHGEDGLLFAEPFLSALAGSFEVVVPSHPGWGGSPRTGRFRGLDDVAYLYLDLLETLPGPVPVAGVSLGGWLAVEMATKCCRDIARLALVAPLGVRLATDPTVRSFLDIYAEPPERVATALYGEPGRQPDLSDVTDEQFAALAQAQESAAFYTWEPYNHNPSLPDRLHRVTVPTLLVGGERDGLCLEPGYLRSLADRITGPTEVTVLPGVGHRVEEQAPRELADLLAGFLGRG